MFCSVLIAVVVVVADRSSCLKCLLPRQDNNGSSFSRAFTITAGYKPCGSRVFTTFASGVDDDGEGNSLKVSLCSCCVSLQKNNLVQYLFLYIYNHCFYSLDNHCLQLRSSH